MINEILFDGLKALEIKTNNWKMVLVVECGPRIAYLGKDNDKNILYWQKNVVSRENWQLHGGHRVWLTRPFADESEDTYMEDNDPCEVTLSSNVVVAMAPTHPFTKLSRGIKVEVINDNTFKVTNIIKNDGPFISSGGVWSPTCIDPHGKEIFVELGEDDTTWDIVKIVIPRVFAGNEVKLDDNQITFEGNQMILRPNGQLTKRCVNSPKGIIYSDWHDERIRFTKKVHYVVNGNYPLGGCNIAVFLGQDNWMAEMETFGIEQPIKPGDQICNEEIWQLDNY